MTIAPMFLLRVWEETFSIGMLIPYWGGVDPHTNHFTFLFFVGIYNVSHPMYGLIFDHIDVPHYDHGGVS